MNAPAWRRDPYRVFFPLGVLLAWAGLFHWIPFSLGGSTEYRSVFHSIAQIQGFMMCFAVGFLFTAIPRRTGTNPPAAWQTIVGMAAPVLTTAFAWFERFAESQLPWFALLVMLVHFAMSRFRSGEATRRPPASFVWIPIALLTGFAGAVLLALYGILGLDFAVHELGQLMILQGVFLGLVAGVGGMALPLITCGDAPPDAPAGFGRAAVMHVVAAAVLLVSFLLEVDGRVRLGLTIRGAIVLALLLGACRIYRAPRKPGAQRWLVWLAAWAIPIGYFIAAWLAPNVQPGLHLTFIAGFGLMALAVGVHVTFAHSGDGSLARTSPWQVFAFGAMVLAAAGMRALVTLDGGNMLVWLGASAGSFLTATLLWLWTVRSPERRTVR